MNKLDKFTFLIPIFNLKDERFENFKFVLTKIKEVTDRILVVEQVRYRRRSTNAKKYTKALGIRYLPVYINDNAIHKSKLINIGTDNIQTEFVWVNDSDCYLKFQKVINQLDFRHNFIQPYVVGKYISKEETQKIFNGENVQIEFAYSKLSETGQHITPGTLYYVSMYGALSFIYEKNAFYNIGGMNEKYAGWGLEDNSICVRMFEYKYSKLDIINIPGIHLYHPRGGYEKEQYNDRTINNVRVYEEEFNNKSYVIHNRLAEYYKKRDEKKIAIIGIERSGTTLLREGISRFLNLTDYNEPFHLPGINNTPEYVDINISLSDYLLFFSKKNNRCIKHIDAYSVCADKYNVTQSEYRDIIRDTLVKSSSSIIITTRNNFLDWVTSFSIALKNNEWCNVNYTTTVDITDQELEWMYTHWYSYHTLYVDKTIKLCERYNKKYQIVEYNDLIHTNDNLNNIGLDITYRDILNNAIIKKQKTKNNDMYIQNYDEVLNWFNKVKNSE